MWCHSLVLVLEPSSAPSGQGYVERLHLLLFFAMDDLPEAAAAWEPQRWCNKISIARTGFCMAKPVPGDVQEDTGVCQLPLSGSCLGGPSLGSRDISQSLRSGGPTMSGCSYRSFVCC